MQLIRETVTQHNILIRENIQSHEFTNTKQIKEVTWHTI